MSYPERGAWRFRNVTKSFQFWPTLDSIGISQEYPDMTATLSCRVVDPDSSLTFSVEDEVRVFFQKHGKAEVRIWAGHLKTVTQDREDEFGPRTWVLDGQDYTAKLSDALVHRRRKRKREKAIRRVRWILRQLDRRIWTLSSKDLSDIPDSFVEKYDYYGASVDEALAHVDDELRLHHFIDLYNGFRMYRQDKVLAPFSLNNDTPDYTSSFPFREYSRAEDSVELANAILVEPEKRKHSRWAKDKTSIAAYKRQERFVSDANIHRPAQAKKVANRELADTKDPALEGRMVVWEPGIYAGMDVNVTEALWGASEKVFVERVDISAVDPHDDDGEAYLRSELTWTRSRRKKRKGGGVKKGLNKVARLRKADTSDVDDHTLDSFDRIVSPPSTIAGDAVGAGWTPYNMQWGELGLAPGGPGPWGPALSAGTTWPIAESGQYNSSWPFVACGVGFGAWSGWSFSEAWYKMVVPAHPVGMAGMRFDATLGYGSGVATGLFVKVMSEAPSAGGQGSMAGFVPAATTTSILITQIPAEGGELWVGFAPSWSPDLDISPYVCVTSPWRPMFTGERDSGRVSGVTLGSATWELLDAGDTDYGSIASDPTAPWEGGNEWRDAGMEGSPTFGMDGRALYVSADEPGGKGWYLAGEREDEDEPDGPWSDVLWSVTATFSVDRIGSTEAGGRRDIELRTVGEGEQTIGRVHLGDTSRAPGISVRAPSAVDYKAKSLTAGTRWMARFDSRSGKLRGKLWLAGDGQPADWDVEVDMAETEDDGDRFELWVRVGDGTTQRVDIIDLKAAESARSGHRVVRDIIGRASGNTNRFKTSHQFREGTLNMRVGGIATPPQKEWGDDALVRLDAKPSPGALIRATYIAD